MWQQTQQWRSRCMAEEHSSSTLTGGVCKWAGGRRRRGSRPPKSGTHFMNHTYTYHKVDAIHGCQTQNFPEKFLTFLRNQKILHYLLLVREKKMLNCLKRLKRLKRHYLLWECMPIDCRILRFAFHGQEQWPLQKFRVLITLRVHSF